MNYTQLRDRAQSGDLLLVEGRGLGSTLIRMVTAQQASHVALLLWIKNGLWVAEMRGRGFILTPASQRVPDMVQHGQVYFGEAPRAVKHNPPRLIAKALSFRGERYSYWSLFTVWLAQLFRRRMRRALVCSTLVEAVWSSAGFIFVKTPDPGDFFNLCESTTPLQFDNKE